MQRSRSEQELRYFWNIWRESTGPPIKNTFMRYLDIANQAARFHGEPFRYLGFLIRNSQNLLILLQRKSREEGSCFCFIKLSPGLTKERGITEFSRGTGVMK